MYIWQYVGGGINEFVDIYEKIYDRPKCIRRRENLEGDGIFSSKKYKKIQAEEPFKIGNLDVTAYRVDHSVPGACGFIIDTSVGKIGISGDIRYRGRRPETTEKFFDKCVEEKVRYMFMEGSLLHFPHSGTEADIMQAVADETKHAALVLYHILSEILTD